MTDMLPEVNQEAQEMGVISEQIAEKIIVEIQKEKIDNDKINRTSQMLLNLINGKYTFDTVKNGIIGGEFPKEVRSGLFTLWGKEIIGLLDEEVAKKRIMSSRQRSASIKRAKAEEQGSDKKASKTKQVEAEAEEDVFSVKKMTLDEIGKELATREEAERGLKEEREKLDKEIQEETKRHARGYQFAFDMFSEAISSAGLENTGNLVELVKKLGNENFGVRQTAIDRITAEKNIGLTFDALAAAMKDKVIVHKVIQAIALAGDFRAVTILLDILLENAGAKESTVRGLAEQAIGAIIQNMNTKQKGSGVKKIFSLIKQPNFEKTLVALMSVIRRDIDSIQMRKYYLNSQCLKLLVVLAQNLIKVKKKKMKVAFFTMTLNTPLTKELVEVAKIVQNILKSA